jgi:hypothetical protein
MALMSRITMAFKSRKDEVAQEESSERPGDWYADPYGSAARRWYDDTRGWTERVEGEGLAPDKTGLARTDDAAAATVDSTQEIDADEPSAVSDAHAVATSTP